MSLDLKLKITGESKEAVAAAKEALKSIEGIKTESVKASKETKALSDAIAGIKSSVAGLVGLSAFTGLAKDILDTNRSMEALRAQLDSVTGSAESGARAFDFVKKFATDTPFEIDGLTKSFISLKNFGIEPTKEVMEAMTNQAARLGASQETLQSIVLQLGQAYQKGKLQQEDMLILAERGVPIYELAAQALNKTGAEIAEMSAKGQMGRDAIDAIIKKMGELTAGSNARAMDTLNGKISNLSDAWHQFEDTLLNDKSEGIIKSIVTSATNSLNILRRNMSTAIDDQIAHTEARIKTYQESGFVGKAVSDYSGFDIGVEINRLATLKKQKVQADAQTAAAEAKEKSAAAIKQTQGWLDEIDAANAESAEKAKKASDKRVKAAESAAKSAARAFAREREAIAGNIADLQFELDTIKLSSEEKQKALKIRSESAGATAAEREKIMALVEAIDAETAAQKRQSEAWAQAVADANEFVDVTKAIQEFASGDVSQSGFNSLLGRIKDDLDAGIISAEQAKQKFDELGKAFNDGFVEPAKAGSDELSQFGVQAARNIQSSFADFIMSAGEGFDDLGANFAKTLARMAADAASAKLMESLLGKGFGTDSATGDGLLQAGLSGLGSLFGGMFGFANGGIMTPSGPLPLRAYAGGGIANSPQLALFGEGRMNEAFVPLPDGRSIPVTMNGGGVTVNVINNAAGYEATTRERQTAQGREIDVIIDQKIRKAMADEKRQGGMLA